MLNINDIRHFSRFGGNAEYGIMMKCCGVNPAYLHFLTESTLLLRNIVLIFCVLHHFALMVDVALFE